MLIVGNPVQALEFSALPNAGVGLARLEFIINNTIGIHPRALLEYDSLPEDIRNEIAPRIHGYASPRDFYIDRLAEGVGTIAAAFYPKPVTVRMSDFKSNEYAALLGGRAFEPVEENPMIGFRGASRYHSESFSDCFALECAAMVKVREEMGLDNLELMIPFARTVEEVQLVLGLMANYGLRRGEHGLKVKLMCEIPANAVRAKQFLEHCDGFSIGSNDLTQLTLGVDRDSGILTGYDERNPAVLALMEMAIRACRRIRQVYRHLRPGPVRFSGNHTLAGRSGHRVHFAEPGQRDEDDRRWCWTSRAKPDANRHWRTEHTGDGPRFHETRGLSPMGILKEP